MRFSLERITGPSIEAVSRADMKVHLRTFADDTSEDTMIDGLIVAAREWVEDYTGRILVDESWRLTLHGRTGANFGGDIVSGHRGPGPVNYGFYSGLWVWGRHGEIMLRKAPVLAITKFVSVDQAGVETAVDPTTYELREADSKWPRIVALNGASWSSWLTGDLRIEFRAGFADRLGSPQQGAEMVPVRFIQAMKLYAESLYDRDPKTMTLYMDTATALIKSERSELSLA